MDKGYKLLAINPGSTSTKIAVFENDNKVFETTIRHSVKEIGKFDEITDQFNFRYDVILNELKENNIDLSTLSAVVGRGGGIAPCEGGTYLVDEKVVEDLRIGVSGQHASSLGGIIADHIAKQYGIKAYIVDPVVVDEMEPIAKITGLPMMKRASRFHALNQKAVGRYAAKECGKKYNEANIVVAHTGGGITVGAHHMGRVIDVTDGYYGDGPFSGNRCGALPSGEVVGLSFSGKYTQKELNNMLIKSGGLLAHLGTDDAREIVARIENGDKEAELVYKAMIYQVAKAIGSYSVVLKGKVDAIVLTGGIAYDKMYIETITDMVSFLAPVKVYPGEFEMEALAEGACRVLSGEEAAKVYKG